MSNIVDGNKSNLGLIGHVKDGSFKSSQSQNFNLDFSKLISMLSAVDTSETLSEEQNLELKRTFSLSEIDNFTKLEKLAKQFVNMGDGYVDEIGEGPVAESKHILQILRGLETKTDEAVDVISNAITASNFVSQLSSLDPPKDPDVEINDKNDNAVDQKFLLVFKRYLETRSGIDASKSTDGENQFAHYINESSLTEDQDVIFPQLDRIEPNDNFFQKKYNNTALDNTKISRTDEFSFVTEKALNVNLANLSFRDLKYSDLKVEFDQPTSSSLSEAPFIATKVFVNSDISTRNQSSNAKVLEINVAAKPSQREITVFELGNKNEKIASVLTQSAIGESGTFQVELPLEEMIAFIINFEKAPTINSSAPIVIKSIESRSLPNNVPDLVNQSEFSPQSAALKVNNDIGEETPFSVEADKTDNNRNFPVQNILKNISGNNQSEHNISIKILPDNVDLADKFNLSFYSEPPVGKAQKPDPIALDYLKGILEKSNYFREQEYLTTNAIKGFIDTSNRSLQLNRILDRMVENEIKKIETIPAKAKLLLSTAEIIGYRQNISSIYKEKKSVQSEFYVGHSLKNLSILSENSILGKNDHGTKVSENSELSDDDTNKFSTLKSDLTNARTDSSTFKNQPSVGNHSNIVKLSLLEAQFSSRLALSLLDQAINSKESFDLILEPESFGKVKVNVSLDRLQLDVKLVADNAATLAILRGSEGVLNSIADSNGLKLAEYSVELNANTQNNGGSRGQKEEDANKSVNIVENQESSEGDLSSSDDSLHSLNLIA